VDVGRRGALALLRMRAEWLVHTVPNGAGLSAVPRVGGSASSDRLDAIGGCLTSATGRIDGVGVLGFLHDFLPLTDEAAPPTTRRTVAELLERTGGSLSRRRYDGVTMNSKDRRRPETGAIDPFGGDRHCTPV